nr:hypothetical protein [uncultured Halomonas sp.]
MLWPNEIAYWLITSMNIEDAGVVAWITLTTLFLWFFFFAVIPALVITLAIAAWGRSQSSKINNNPR